MASGTLQQKVSQGKSLVRGQNGVLAEETQPDIQQLSGQAGLQAPPIDPMSAATIGANPHQQKMMGTPAQTQAAATVAQDSTTSLQDTVRRQKDRSQATGDEQAEKDKSAQLQNLGPLGDRVSDFMEGQRKKLAAQGVIASDAQVDVPTSAAQVTGLPSDPTQLAVLKDAAKAYRDNPQDMKALLAINKALGRDPNSQVTPDQVASLYENSTATLARSGADAVSNSLTVGDLATQPEFGYDLQSLGDLLEVDPQDLDKWTVPQLQERMQELTSKHFSNVQVNDAKASSNLLGGAERQLARSQGREQSAVGLRSTEADVQRLDQQIANADTVNFDGQSYKVEDLLKDDTISGIITDYLNAPAGSPVRQQLEQSEPELLKFIQSNQAVLDDAAKARSAGTDTFADIQKSNGATATVQGVALPPELMKAINPNFGQLSSEKFDPSTSGLLQHLNSLPPDQAKQAATNVSSLVAKYPDVAGQFAGLSADDVAQLGLNLANPSPKLQAFVKNQDEWKDIHNTDPKDIDHIVQMITGDSGLTTDKAQGILDTNKAAGVLGLKAPSNDQLDLNGDGKVDSPADLYQALVKSTPKGTLKDAVNGSVTSFTPKDLTTYAPTKPEEQLVWSRLKDAAADGSISASDISSARFNEAELQMISDAGYPAKWGVQAKTAISRQLEGYTTARTVKALDTIYSTNDSPVAANINSLTHLIESTKQGVPDVLHSQDTEAAFTAYADQAAHLIKQLQQTQHSQGSLINSATLDADISKLRTFIRDSQNSASALAASRTQEEQRLAEKAAEAASRAALAKAGNPGSGIGAVRKKLHI